MNQSTPDEPKSRRTVLELIAERTGQAPKVLLTDSGSEHGASPVVDPGSAASKRVPQGRGKYQMLGEIARGGMGVILKGHDTDLGRDVAIKVLDGSLSKNPAVVQRFVEEAQIGGQLQHPGIVPVYDLGLMADDCPYFTMKLVKGRTLSALLQQRKSSNVILRGKSPSATAPLDNRGRLLAIFESVCQTMAYAHSKGVLHRDLKPANVMVGAFGEVQVVDWGLAKVLHRGGVADERRAKETLHTVIETVRSGPGSSGSDSLVGSVMGTPAYMAPEQAQGEIEKLDERADVFSLGAILCEILTGRPPYEEIEGEPIVTQAARGRLDPARARIEACDADPALVRLCLDCLMPARAARPANAEEVAKTLHEYLVSVEERAQKAELAAAEARIKAAEERRARRLTVALAGTIAAVLLVGGGGFYWVNHEREQRVEQTRVAVEAAHGESIDLGQAGKPEEALAAARRALSVAEGGDADAALLERSRTFVAKSEEALGAAERERALLAQDEALLSRLIDLRIRQIGTIGQRPREIELDAAFTKTFQDYGVDLEGADLVPALNRIRERAIGEEVALALDDWGRLRRTLHGAKSEKAENLYYLAMDLDPEPLRMRMREAVAAKDLAVMLELASPESLPKLQPGSIFVLSAALFDGFPDRREDVDRMLGQSVRLYPGDYVLQSATGIVFEDAGRHEEALACRTAALALRPNDVTARQKLADSQYYLGRWTESAASLRAILAVEPDNWEAHSTLGSALHYLGDREGALAHFQHGPAPDGITFWQADLQAVQFFSGVLSREEVARRAAAEPNPDMLLVYLYALVDHPDPAQRDPEFVLRELEQRRTAFSAFRWPSVVEAVARVRLSDWEGARLALENRYQRPRVVIMTPMAYEFVRSLVYSGLDRDGEALACYQRGMTQWEEATRDDPAAWERSDAMRWRREAEAVLAE